MRLVFITIKEKMFNVTMVVLLLIDPLIRYGQYGIHSSQYGCFGEFVQRDSMQHQRLETFKILKRPKNRTL